MDKKPTHVRCGKTIKSLNDGRIDNHESINKAKKASRRLQDAGAILRVVDLLPTDTPQA